MVTITAAHRTNIEKIGGTDTGHVTFTCSCGKQGMWHPQRTTEGIQLARRDAQDHLAATSKAA